MVHVLLLRNSGSISDSKTNNQIYDFVISIYYKDDPLFIDSALGGYVFVYMDEKLHLSLSVTNTFVLLLTKQ